VKNYTVQYDKTWIHDKIHHAINEFCSIHTLQEVYIEKFEQLDEALVAALQQTCNVWAPGIEIVAVRVTKPRIPESIRRNFEQMETEKTQFLIAVQKQKVVTKEAETERRKAVIHAEKLKEVAVITMEKEISEKLSEQQMSSIADQMHVDRESSLAEAYLYSIRKEAESNALKLTPSFLALEKIFALAENSDIVFGDSIPTFMSSDMLAHRTVYTDQQHS